MNQFAVIVAAAGSGTRFDSGNQKKTYALLGGMPVWQHCVRRFAARDDVRQVLIVVSPEDVDWFASSNEELISDFGAVVVAGGSERTDSVENGLASVSADIEYVAIHDAARPCASAAMIERTFALARQLGNATPAIPVSSTLKKSADGLSVIETVDRAGLFMAQTPQVFRVAELCEAYERRGSLNPTDEAQLFELVGREVFLAEGCPLNIKITTRRDMEFAAAALQSLKDHDSRPVHFDGPLGDSQLR